MDPRRARRTRRRGVDRSAHGPICCGCSAQRGSVSAKPTAPRWDRRQRAAPSVFRAKNNLGTSAERWPSLLRVLRDLRGSSALRRTAGFAIPAPGSSRLSNTSVTTRPFPSLLGPASPCLRVSVVKTLRLMYRFCSRSPGRWTTKGGHEGREEKQSSLSRLVPVRGTRRLRGLRVPLRAFVVKPGRTNSVHEPTLLPNPIRVHS